MAAGLVSASCHPNQRASLPDGASETIDTPRSPLPTLPLDGPRLAIASTRSSVRPTVCALDVQGWLTCEGVGADDLMPPVGQFVDVVSTHHGFCALSPKGEAVCWGGAEPAAFEVEGERFVEIVGDKDAFCGLLADGSVLCPGARAPRWEAGASRLVAPGAVLDAKGRLIRREPIDEERVEGAFEDIDISATITVGRRSNGALTIWGEHWAHRHNVEGRWGRFTLNSGNVVALDDQGQMHVFDTETDSFVALPPPPGVVDLDDMTDGVCGLYADGRHHCESLRGGPWQPRTAHSTVTSRPDDPERARLAAVQPTEVNSAAELGVCGRYTACICSLADALPGQTQVGVLCRDARTLLSRDGEGGAEECREGFALLKAILETEAMGVTFEACEGAL